MVRSDIEFWFPVLVIQFLFYITVRAGMGKEIK